MLKGRAREHVYLETDQDQVKFTNSCWEIQRLNPLQGGSIVIGEIVRLRHIGTGKYLALDVESKTLELVSSSASLSCLFFMRAQSGNSKSNTFVD